MLSLVYSQNNLDLVLGTGRPGIQGHEVADGGGLLEEGGDAEEVAFLFPGGHYLEADGEAGLCEAAGTEMVGQPVRVRAKVSMSQLM